MFRSVPPVILRWVAMGLFFLVGIPGMIVASITGHDGAAVTFGIFTATVALCLLAVTAVVVDPSRPLQTEAPAAPADLEARGEELEARIEQLVARGTDEGSFRDLVRAAVRLARATG